MTSRTCEVAASKPAALGRAIGTGGLVNYQVELVWPVDAAGIPAPEAVEVRVYPTAWGWFGWTVDRILGSPEISADGRTWIYRSERGLKMDYAYSRQVDAATEMVAVFYEGVESGPCTVIPDIRVTGPSVGDWKRMDLEIEWGFQAGTERADFEGRLETHVAMTGPVSPLPGDAGTVVTAGNQWKSQASGGARRGVAVPVVYAPSSRLGLDSRITVWTGRMDSPSGSATWIPARS